MSDLIKEMRSFQLYPDHYLRLGADEIERLTAGYDVLLDDRNEAWERVAKLEAVIKTLYTETSDNWVQQHIQECGLANSEVET